MKHVSRLSLAAIALLALGLSGCQIVHSPMLGLVFTEAKYGFVATDASAANKEGKACGTSILGLVAQGDASVTAAKSNGNINTVSAVDHYAKNILGIYGEFCTIVRGS